MECYWRSTRSTRTTRPSSSSVNLRPAVPGLLLSKYKSESLGDIHFGNKKSHYCHESNTIEDFFRSQPGFNLSASRLSSVELIPLPQSMD
ncbi:hypothetical protein H5410_031613 [Solanum commersonii]|uniref:Uncharacterized protein n=1 Tax=Solanum commersonii TaxID=4109 RepID=A0A9J5YHN6_SOLCO|nr:hypothetical protein H5410_031613 [Solanum commersonii]